MTLLSSAPRFTRFSLAGALALGFATLSGCGNQPLVLTTPLEGGLVSGKAMGGETPVTGATVTLYATAASTSVSNGVYQGTAQVLGTVTSGSDGGFSFNPSSYTCPPNQEVYITSYGGNAGAGSNNNVLEVAMIGQCGNLNAFTDVNELTTLAAAYAFSSFMSIDTSGATPVVNITAPAANASFAASNDVSSGTVTTASGLLHAYQNAINLVDVSHGTAYAVPPSNSAAIAPNVVLNSLGNILQACVNSTGGTAGDLSNCGKLFGAAPSRSGSAPTNTLQAALNIARNPYSSAANVLTLFNLAAPQLAFAPVLTTAPKDWTVAISYPVPPNPVSGVGFPFMLALDADDNVYVTSPENDPWAPTASAKSTTNSTSACLFGWSSNGTFLPAIVPYSGTPGTPGTVGTGTPGTSSWFCSGTQAATPQTDYLLAALAADNVGNIWINNFGSGTATPTPQDPVVKVSKAGAWQAQYIPPVQAGATQAFQNVGIVVDKSNNVWFNALSASSAVPNLIAFAAGAGGTGSTGAALTIGSIAAGPTFSSAGRGLAFDSAQNFIGASYGGSSGTLGSLSLGGAGVIVPITGVIGANPANYGALIKKSIGSGSGSGTTTNEGPWGVAVDSASDYWFTTASATGQTVATGAIGLYELVPVGSPITTTTAGTTVTTGFTSPKGLEADGDNVLWIADTTGIQAYSTSAPPVTTFLSEAGGFSPCIPTGTVCTYPDNLNTKNVAVDSTGSVWWTTPDTTTTNANSNRLIQLIGTGTATWPLLATGKPGTMPQ
jgi:hypothetical protein